MPVRIENGVTKKNEVPENAPFVTSYPRMKRRYAARGLIKGVFSAAARPLAARLSAGF
jgi:hypothetical protein